MVEDEKTLARETLNVYGKVQREADQILALVRGLRKDGRLGTVLGRSILGNLKNKENELSKKLGESSACENKVSKSAGVKVPIDESKKQLDGVVVNLMKLRDLLNQELKQIKIQELDFRKSARMYQEFEGNLDNFKKDAEILSQGVAAVLEILNYLKTEEDLKKLQTLDQTFIRKAAETNEKLGLLTEHIDDFLKLYKTLRHANKSIVSIRGKLKKEPKLIENARKEGDALFEQLSQSGLSEKMVSNLTLRKQVLEAALKNLETATASAIQLSQKLDTDYDKIVGLFEHIKSEINEIQKLLFGVLKEGTHVSREIEEAINMAKMTLSELRNKISQEMAKMTQEVQAIMSSPNQIEHEIQQIVPIIQEAIREFDSLRRLVSQEIPIVMNAANVLNEILPEMQ